MADANDDLLDGDGDLIDGEFDLDGADEDALLADDYEQLQAQSKSQRPGTRSADYIVATQDQVPEDEDAIELGVHEDLGLTEEEKSEPWSKTDRQVTADASGRTSIMFSNTPKSGDSDDEEAGRDNRARFKTERNMTVTTRVTSSIPETLDGVVVQRGPQGRGGGNRGRGYNRGGNYGGGRGRGGGAMQQGYQQHRGGNHSVRPGPRAAYEQESPPPPRPMYHEPPHHHQRPPPPVQHHHQQPPPPPRNLCPPPPNIHVNPHFRPRPPITGGGNNWQSGPTHNYPPVQSHNQPPPQQQLPQPQYHNNNSHYNYNFHNGGPPMQQRGGGSSPWNEGGGPPPPPHLQHNYYPEPPQQQQQQQPYNNYQEHPAPFYNESGVMHSDGGYYTPQPSHQHNPPPYQGTNMNWEPPHQNSYYVEDDRHHHQQQQQHHQEDMYHHSGVPPPMIQHGGPPPTPHLQHGPPPPQPPHHQHHYGPPPPHHQQQLRIHDEFKQRPPHPVRNQFDGPKQHNFQGKGRGSKRVPMKRDCEMTSSGVGGGGGKAQRVDAQRKGGVVRNLHQVQTVDSLPDTTTAGIDQEEEDEEMKEYRLKIEAQKKLRAQILKMKEEKRAASAQQRNKLANTTVVGGVKAEGATISPVTVSTSDSGGNTLPPEQQFRIVRMRTKDGRTITKRLSLAEIMKLRKVTPEVKKVIPPNKIAQGTAGPTSKEGVVGNIVELSPTQRACHSVVVNNLSATTTKKQLLTMGKLVGPVKSVELDSSAGTGKAIVKFEESKDAAEFLRRFQRKMVDLSMISLSLAPD